MLETGQIVTKTNDEVRCMINGDLAIENYEPSARLDGERSEPVSIQQGPQKGDILLVLIDQCRAACEVLDVSIKKGRPLYLVKYDDGMLVQDHLVVPWSYVSTAPTTSGAIAPAATISTDSKPSVAATESVSASAPVAPSTSKSLGKRRMIDVIPYVAETAPAAPKREAREREIEHEKKSVILLEEMQKAKAAQEAAAGLLPLSHPLHLQPEHEKKRKLEKEEHRKKTNLEKRYGELLDSIVL
jgi:hypothetical protein